MTLRFIEGFENNQHTTYHDRVYANTYGVVNFGQTGRRTGDAVTHYATQTKPNFTTRALSGSSLNEWVLGFGFKASSVMGTGSQTNSLGFHFMDASGNQCFIYIVRIDANTVAWRLARGTYLGDVVNVIATSTPFNPLVWHYFELKVNIRTGTNGSYEMRMHNHYSGEITTILSGSGVNLANQGSDGATRITIRMQSEPAAFYGFLDDIYLLDTGTGTHTNYLGDCVVQGFMPNAQGDVTECAPGGNSNWQAVDDPATTPEDGNYTTAGSAPLTDLFGYQLVSSSVPMTVFGVRLNTTAVLPSAGSETLVHRVRDGDDNDNDGDTFTIDSTAASTDEEVMEVDPHTSVAWTPARLDDTQFGYRRQT